MKVFPRKPKVRVTFQNGAVRFGEVNHTTMLGWYNVTLDDEVKSIEVPGHMVDFLADIGVAPRVADTRAP